MEGEESNTAAGELTRDTQTAESSTPQGDQPAQKPTVTTTFDLFSVDPSETDQEQEHAKDASEAGTNEQVTNENPSTAAHVHEEDGSDVPRKSDALQESQFESMDLENLPGADKDISASLYASSIASQFEELDIPAPRGSGEESRSQVSDPADSETERPQSDDGTAIEAAQPANEVDSSWVDVLGDGSLRKRTLKRGDGRHTRPLNGQLCTVVYSVWYLSADDAKLSDFSSVQSEPDFNGTATLPLGESEFCIMFDLCVPLMEAHELSEVVAARRHWQLDPMHNLPASLSSQSPPIAAVRLQIELANVASRHVYASMPIHDVCVIADRKRELGNACYSANEQVMAVTHYCNAISAIEESESAGTPNKAAETERTDVKLKCWANLAAAQLKLKEFDECVRSCNKVLHLQADNVKVLLRKAKALHEKHELEEALACYKKALALDPSSRFVQTEVTRLEQRIRDANARERTLYKRMFAPTDDVAGNTDAKKDAKKSNAPDSKKPAASRWPNLLTSSMVFAAAGVAVASVAFAVFKQYASSK